MILLVHLLFGAAIGSVLNNIPIAIVVAFFSHYFLDLFPHIEYDIEIKNKKQWREELAIAFKIIIDFCLGILLIFLFSTNQPITYICAFFAILPDGFTVLSNNLPNSILKNHDIFHTKKIHFFRYKKISVFWRLLSQIMVVLVSIFLLRL